MRELILVYHAKSGVWNGLLDSIHKWASPSTYPCQLCAITYGHVSMKREWKKYIESLDFPVTFYHLDDLPSDYPETKLPCGFLRTSNGLQELISREEINSCKNVKDLISIVKNKLK
ncbi:hypothetical protein [Alkalihalobacterium elongatum]|uniref:hypothetical protein n=1 Tax=Alkalihalobacterium elongatum TaxID=2675466 RepID=UPI001C1FF283|nr:hypothetical protein [Alkalihalobacterium elongatum]